MDKINFSENKKMNLNIIKNLPLEPTYISSPIEEGALKTSNSEPYKNNTLMFSGSNKSGSLLNSQTEQNLLGSKVSNDHFDVQISQCADINDICGEKDRLDLIKKQNEKINELFGILDSKDQEIQKLKNENSMFHKLKDDFIITEQNYLNANARLNKYQDALVKNKNELSNTVIKLNSIQKSYDEIQEIYLKNKQEYDKISVAFRNLESQLKVILTENQQLSSQNKKLINKIKEHEEQNLINQNKIQEFSNSLCNKQNEIKELNILLDKASKTTFTLDQVNKENIQKIKSLTEENLINKNQIGDLNLYSRTILDNGQKISYLQELNERLNDEINCLNGDRNELLVTLNDIFDSLSKHGINVLNQSVIFIDTSIDNIRKSKEDTKYKNENENENIKKEENQTKIPELRFNEYFSCIIKEIPSFSKILDLFDRLMEFGKNIVEKCGKLNKEYEENIKYFKNKINIINENLYQSNQQLINQKQTNTLLKSDNRKTEIERDRNVNDLLNDKDKIKVEYEMLKKFITDTYISIIKNYNEISNRILQKINYNNNTNTNSSQNCLPFCSLNLKKNTDCLNYNVKEIIIEQENLFKYLLDDFVNLYEKVIDVEKIKSENYLLVQTNRTLCDNINELKNEIKGIDCVNQNNLNFIQTKNDLNLRNQRQDIENKNKEIINQYIKQLKLKDEELEKVKKNYNLLYNQYKLLISKKKIE